MRGYLGNQTKSRQAKSGNKSKGGPNRRRRRRPPQAEFPDDDDASLEVIPPDQLEASKNVMNLTELKTRPAAKLVELGESLGLENLARSRKQDIIFSILKAHAKLGENIYGDGTLEILQDERRAVRQRELLLLRIEEHKTYKEIAEITGLTATNVGYILHKAVKALSRKLNQRRAEET